MRIKRAFPNLPNDWYEVFQNRITENEFTDERLRDAVNYVIDNCQYPTPTIAQFIGFDRKVVVKTYQQLLKALNDDPKAFDHYQAVKVQQIDHPMYARKEDIQKYKLKLFTKDDQVKLNERIKKEDSNEY